jgi:DNA-binding FadR family transcriptional regulator
VLSSQSLIRSARGKGGGTYVSLPTPELIAGQLETALTLLSGSTYLSIDELIETRRLLEVPAAGLAATRRTSEQLEVLDSTLTVEAAALHEHGEPAGRKSFHEALLDAANNNLVSVLTHPLFAVLQQKFVGVARSLEFWERIHDDHTEIRNRIAAGDAQGGERAMRDHLGYLESTYTLIAEKD